MRIYHPAEKSFLETPCTGCPCHWDARILMGSSLSHGCCRECGCPRDEEGWAFWIEQKDAQPIKHFKGP